MDMTGLHPILAKYFLWHLPSVLTVCENYLLAEVPTALAVTKHSSATSDDLKTDFFGIESEQSIQSSLPHVYSLTGPAHDASTRPKFFLDMNRKGTYTAHHSISFYTARGHYLTSTLRR